MSAASPPGWWLRGDEGDVMATPPMAPAGWYTDPAGRHEKRYWDGTGWTAGVSDGGVAGTDPPGSPPTPLSERPAGQVTAPAASAPVTVPAATDAPGGAVPAAAVSAAAVPATDAPGGAVPAAAVPPAAPATAG